MTKSAPKFFTGVFACVALLCGAPTQAQLPTLGTITDFSHGEYFEPPHHTQMKFQLTGAEGRPQGSDKVQITKAKLRRFRETGETEIIVEAPECIYDKVRHEAGSPGPLRVQTGDGRFIIEGEGFLWRETDSTLTISNRIRSEVRRVLTNSPPGEVKPPFVITSRRFVFEVLNRRGVFRESVHGEDSQMKFDSGVLTVSASTNGQSCDLLVAEKDVSIVSKTDGRTIGAQRAVYTRANEIMELIGNAVWKQGPQEGRSDRAVIRQLEKSFEGSGNVAIKLPRDSLGLGGFFAAATNAPPKANTDQPTLVDLFADRFQSRSNLSIAEGAVRVVDTTNRLSCDKLTVETKKGPLAEDVAVADGNVIVTQGDQNHRIRAKRAVYTKSDGLMVFTGRPEWNLEQSEGRADQMTIHRPTGEIHATGNVAAKVTVGAQQGSVLKLFPEPGDTNQAPRVIEVFGKDLRVKDRLVTLVGDARAHQSPITGSEPRLRSETMDVRFGTNVHAMETIQARNNVVYEQGTLGVTNGPNAYRKMLTRTLTARADPKTGALGGLLAEGGVQIEQFENIAKGERATYTGATDVLELTGKPTLETPDIIITDARTLVWDKANQQFTATAPYKIQLRADVTKRTVEPPVTP